MGHTRRERRNTMNTQGFVAGPLSVLCVIALVMGTAGAAVIATTGSASDNGAKPAHQHLSPESIINHLEEQGVDVAEAKTAFQNGDTEALKAWLEAHRPERPEGAGRSPPDLTNPTSQEKIITRLEERGVDVTEVKTLLQDGDSAAVQVWLEAYFQANRPERPDASGRSPPDLTDPTKQQEIITRLEERGVDITEVKTLLQNGDTEAVTAWLEAHRPEGSGRSPPDLSDPVQEQKIIDKIGEQGVDVSEVETDLQNGDTTAVQAWLESYLHSHEGEMGFHHHSGSPAVIQSGTSE
jgi:DNA-binding transcriptional MerR regulator